MGVIMTPLLGSCAYDELSEIAGGGDNVLSFGVEVKQLYDSQGWTRASGPQMRPMHSLELTSANGDTIYARSQSLGIINEHSNVSSVTRAAAKTTDAFYESFGVIAFNYASTSLWDNVKSSATPSVYNAKASLSNGKWVVGSNNYWPGASKKVSFFAYAPFSDNNSGIALSAQTAKGVPTITYTVPSTAANQSDLLVATALNQDGSGTSSPSLQFSHALCCVKFAVGTMAGIDKITKIAISGVKNKGTLEIGGATWNVDNSSTSSYTIQRDISVSGISNQDITSGDDLLFLMPQTVPSGATLTITADGNDYSTSIAGESWAMGAMVTYKLSINKITGRIEFSATPSKATVSKDGENITFTVNSYIEYTNSNSLTVLKAIPWTSAIKDINGNTLSYSGDNIISTTNAVKINTNTLRHSEVLKATNYSDEKNPHDLSMFDGKQSTANCYVVQGCGWFKLPLVYGNGITNGVVAGKSTNASSNTFGYNTSTSFVNHAGTAIYTLSNAPYIYGNGYDPTTAEVVWQSISGLITNPSILEGQYLKFYVDPTKVDQANAVIAVKSSGTIVWSWHLWFTASSWTATYTYGSNNFMTMPLGYIDSSGSVTVTPRTLPFTFNQVISSGKTTTVSVSQNGDASTGGTCTFYQWGRKDPFNGTTSSVASQTAYYNSITKPGIFIQGTENSPYYYNWFNGNLLDLWNVGNSETAKTTSTSQKTIYDPSPVGFKVPPPAAFTDIGLSKNYWNSTSGNEGISVPNTDDFWRAFGRLEYESGSLSNVGSYGYYWSCGPSEMPSNHHGWSLCFSSSSVMSTTFYYRANGFSVRPVSE